MSETDDGSDHDDAPEDHAYECPACAQTVHATPGETAQLVECSACGAHFVIPSLNGSTDLPGETGPSEEEKKQHAEGELNSLRMRHIIVTRRTAIRSRTYNIVGVALCIMGAIKLVIMTVQDVRAGGWHLLQWAYIVLAVAALYAAGYLCTRIVYWTRQSRAPIFFAGKCANCGQDLPEGASVCLDCGTRVQKDETPPDFSTLSDGSQHAKNLENL